MAGPEFDDPTDPDGATRAINDARTSLEAVRRFLPKANLSRAERTYFEDELAYLEGKVQSRYSREQEHATERITFLLVAAAVGTPYSKPSPIREPRSGSRRGSRSGSCKCVGRKLGCPRNSAKTTRRRHAHPRVRLSRDLTPANRITDEIYREVSPGT
jgi:hypothetical protein